MSTSLREAIDALLESLSHKKELDSLDPGTQEMLDRALDKVVEGTDRKISMVPGFKRKLFKSIIQSLEYADNIIEQIPDAIELSREQFVANPYVRAYFHTVTGLNKVCSKSSELKDYFQDSGQGESTESCALLCMKRVEENVLGMDLEGDQVVRDVMQTRVTFKDHRIQSPAEDEHNARRELKCCIFEGLVDNALANISKLRARRRYLETERQRINSRLRSQGVSQDGSEAARLEQIEQELQQIGYVTPEVSLGQVNGILGHPEEFVSIRNVSMMLDKAGIVRTGDEDKGSVSHLEFSEVSIKGQPSRVVTLAKIRREDLAPNQLSFPSAI